MLSLKDFKKSSFAEFEGSQIFKLSNVVGGDRIRMSSSKGSGGGSAYDTADETGGPSGQGAGSGGQWDDVKWTSTCC